MVEDEISKLMEDTKKFLKEQNEYNYKDEFEKSDIVYVLKNTKETEKSIIGILGESGEIYEVILKDKIIDYIREWEYSVAEYILDRLEKEFDIGYMSMNGHATIWDEIVLYYEEDIGEKDVGLQKYLKFCKDSDIDKQTIEKEVESNVENAMAYYKEITDYLTIENGQVEMPVEIYKKEENKNYVRVALAYKIAREIEEEKIEDETLFEFCDKLANEYMKTDYPTNYWGTVYSNLEDWIKDNKDIIKSRMLMNFGIDNKYIMEIGKRGDTPVALVEIILEEAKREYAIAFNYEVNDKKTEWGYGFYYNNDINKAQRDFEKVKAGGNLEDIFNKKKNKFKER